MLDAVPGRLGISDDGGRARRCLRYDDDGVRVAQVVDPGTASEAVTTYLVDKRNATGYSQVLQELAASESIAACAQSSTAPVSGSRQSSRSTPANPSPRTKPTPA